MKLAIGSSRVDVATASFWFAAVAFWLLRFTYWRTHEELPFSDMEDFIRIAGTIRSSGSFVFDSFWQTYRLPVVPLMMAATSFASGAFNLHLWQVWQTVFVFLSLLWLARELRLGTGNAWLGIALIASVAITRSSIFWSYKAATESVSEGFAYCLLASALAFARRQSLPAALATGVIAVASSLTRANAAPMIPIMGLFVVGYTWRHGGLSRRMLWIALAYALGVAVTWAPWLVHSYRLYGHPVAFTTQGPYTFLWELGKVKVTLADGTPALHDMNDMQAEAAQRFKTDYDASKYGDEVVRGWLRENWRSYLRLIRPRLLRQISDRGEYLTKLPRDNLFGIHPEPLLDKSRSAVFMGLGGLVLFVLAYGAWAAPLAILPLVLLSFGALFLGYPRMFDPYLPLSLYGIFLLPFALWRLGVLLRNRLKNNQ